MALYSKPPRKIEIPLLPAQRELERYMFDNVTERIGLGGNRKGGKSYGGRVMMILRRLKYPGTNGLILRETLPEVLGNHSNEIVAFLRNTLGMQSGTPAKPKDFTYIQKDHTFIFHKHKFNGVPSQLILGYARNLADAERYQGTPYLDVWADEAEHFRWSTLRPITGSLQNVVHENVTPKLLCTFNPGGIGHKWLKAMFVDEKTRPEHTVWIPARLQDNTYMAKTDPRFAQRLRTDFKNDPVKLAQWLDGDWSVTEDQYFSIDHSYIRDVTVPHYATWWCGVDWGYYPSAFAAVWGASWEDAYTGQKYCYVAHELRLFRTHLDQQAYACLRLEETENIPPPLRFADPAAWHKNPGQSTDGATHSVVNGWRENGFYVQKSSRDAKVQGLIRINELLQKGVLIISPRCQCLIEELMEAIYEKTSDGRITGNTDPSQPDDMTDALRYAIVKLYRGAWSKKPNDPWADLREVDDEEDEPTPSLRLVS